MRGLGNFWSWQCQYDIDIINNFYYSTVFVQHGEIQPPQGLYYSTYPWQQITFLEDLITVDGFYGQPTTHCGYHPKRASKRITIYPKNTWLDAQLVLWVCRTHTKILSLAKLVFVITTMLSSWAQGPLHVLLGVLICCMKLITSS